MAQNPANRQSRDVSGKGSERGGHGEKNNNKKNELQPNRSLLKSKGPPLIEGENQMKKLFTSTLLTVVAVPFLMAAPSAAKKAQNQPQASTETQSTTVKTKTHKKHTKKAQKNTASTVDNSAATSSASPKQ